MTGLVHLILWATVTLIAGVTADQGTTEDIQRVFNGRCWDYDVTRYNDLLPRVETGCLDLWNFFFEAFSYQPPCGLPKMGYATFMESAKQELPRNKILLWSGTYSLAHRYAKKGVRFITLEDTMIGYLLDQLTWCGQSTDPGMNFTRCPDWEDCPDEATGQFWAEASAMFASQGRGNVTVMLDGSNKDRPAYRNDSYFGMYELPNLSPQTVTSLNALVTHKLGEPKLETCSTGSLLSLRKDVEAKGIPYTCVDNPAAVLHIMCSDHPTARECELAKDHMSGRHRQYADEDMRRRR